MLFSSPRSYGLYPFSGGSFIYRHVVLERWMTLPPSLHVICDVGMADSWPFTVGLPDRTEATRVDKVCPNDKVNKRSCRRRVCEKFSAKAVHEFRRQ
jgi:hypothetical protein